MLSTDRRGTGWEILFMLGVGVFCFVCSLVLGVVLWFGFFLVWCFCWGFFKVCLMQDSGILQTILYYLELLIVVLSKWCLAAATASWDVEMSQLWILAARSILLLLWEGKGTCALPQGESSVSWLGQLFSCYLRCKADPCFLTKTATARHVACWNQVIS